MSSGKMFSSLSGMPTAPQTNTLPHTTGTGSRVSALASSQQSGSLQPSFAMLDTPTFTGLVPDTLLAACTKKRARKHATHNNKCTVLYRRVSSIQHMPHQGYVARTTAKGSAAKCLVCKVGLVKTSRLPSRSGVVINCGCGNVRVCFVCFKNSNNAEPWYTQQPHLNECSKLKLFFCSECKIFDRIRERICCRWVCPRCAEFARMVERCQNCSTSLAAEKMDKESLWTDPICAAVSGQLSQQHTGSDVGDLGGSDACEATAEGYRDAIKERVMAKVTHSRHLTAEDIQVLFPECPPDPKRCTCLPGEVPGAMCPGCMPMLTIMRLLSENTDPLMATFAERAVPGRALTRNVYNKNLLQTMFGDSRLPPCAHGKMCKGMLLRGPDGRTKGKPLPSLLSPEAYRMLDPETDPVKPCSCILCLLVHQTATVVANVCPDSENLEPFPSEPVYYFNIKMTRDIGIPEILIQDCGRHLINFQGRVGSYKPDFYYNWKDMFDVLCIDESGSVIFKPSPQ